MLTFEHELVHGIQHCLCLEYEGNNKGPGNWKGITKPSDGHSKTFMSILNNTFGHIDFRHGLFQDEEDFDMLKTRLDHAAEMNDKLNVFQELHHWLFFILFILRKYFAIIL